MKMDFLLVVFFLFAVVSFADPPPETTAYLSLDNDCGHAMGFISATHNWSTHYDYIVVKPLNHASFGSGYYAIGRIGASGSIQYDSFFIWYRTDGAKVDWFAVSTSAQTLDECQTAFRNAVVALTNEERLNTGAMFDTLFPDEEFISRLPMDIDLNLNGRYDYYDLDSAYYQTYLEDCLEYGVDPGDLRDYMFWYQQEISLWLSHRENMVDSNGDGWSDGYAAIRGYGPNDTVTFLGRPDVGGTGGIFGGVDDPEAWRYEEYADGWSRGHVYDMGYDPFGQTPIAFINADFTGPPDWYSLDSSGDGVPNWRKIELEQNPYEFNFQSGFVYNYNESGGYWEFMGGVTDDDFPNWSAPPTYEEWLEEYESRYGTGDYYYSPGDPFDFDDPDLDSMYQKFGRLQIDVDSVRPQSERDYRIIFNLPFPGGRSEMFVISVMPDTSTSAGAALETLRQVVRGMTVVVFSYIFGRHVWLVLRQW